MRSRIPLFALVFVVSSLVLPAAAHAGGIPFFGPIIPNEQITVNGVVTNQNVCAAGWGMLMIVVNNLISFLITIAIVFVAPLMIAWSGFLFVVNPVNASGKEQAKKILTNTVVGIVIALAGWLIVDAIMAVLYNPNAQSGVTKLGVWSSLITSGDLSKTLCIPLKASLAPAGPPPVGVEVACSIPPLSPLTDSLALQMEGGQTVIWTNTSPQLQSCANKFVGKVGGGTVTSAYRPQAYQTHLYEIRDRWCTQNLKSNSDSLCSALKSTISAEVTKHSLSACGPVAAGNSTHLNGTGVDISGVPNQGSSVTTNLAKAACLQWYGAGDAVHYTLDLTISGCSCQ